jgi:hypothetical protein
VSTTHWTQRWFEHFGAAAEQSTSARHSTHSDRLVSHRGVAPEQFALLVQPATQVSTSGWQTGVEPPQSALPRHCAQMPRARHRGADAGQSEPEAHSTQMWLVVLQIGAPRPQSELVRHVSHAPVPWSQNGAMTGGHPAAPDAVHEAWHWWSPGQHAGALAPQSAFERHATHAPVEQNFVPPPQSASLTHSTHPRVGSHFALPQAFALLQTLPAGMPPLLLLLLHAAAATRPAARTKERIERIAGGPEQEIARRASVASVTTVGAQRCTRVCRPPATIRCKIVQCEPSFRSPSPSARSRSGATRRS